MRQIVLDTETTGLDPKSGHRLVEIGCLELWHYVPTGKVFHQYLNPQREVPKEATNVHGLTTEFLKKHPLFSDVVEDFLTFLGDAQLIIHNAPFDLKFLNAELAQLEKHIIASERAIDTLMLAKRKFPGSPASLDALCRRFDIDLSGRSYHGALLDAELLAKVYLELIGGKQPAFFENMSVHKPFEGPTDRATNQRMPAQFPARTFEISALESEAHAEMLKRIKNPVWG